MQQFHRCQIYREKISPNEIGMLVANDICNAGTCFVGWMKLSCKNVRGVAGCKVRFCINVCMPTRLRCQFAQTRWCLCTFAWRPTKNAQDIHDTTKPASLTFRRLCTSRHTFGTQSQNKWDTKWHFQVTKFPIVLLLLVSLSLMLSIKILHIATGLWQAHWIAIWQVCNFCLHIHL